MRGHGPTTVCGVVRDNAVLQSRRPTDADTAISADRVIVDRQHAPADANTGIRADRAVVDHRAGGAADDSPDHIYAPCPVNAMPNCDIAVDGATVDCQCACGRRNAAAFSGAKNAKKNAPADTDSISADCAVVD